MRDAEFNMICDTYRKSPVPYDAITTECQLELWSDYVKSPGTNDSNSAWKRLWNSKGETDATATTLMLPIWKRLLQMLPSSQTPYNPSYLMNPTWKKSITPPWIQALGCIKRRNHRDGRANTQRLLQALPHDLEDDHQRRRRQRRTHQHQWHQQHLQPRRHL